MSRATDMRSAYRRIRRCSRSSETSRETHRFTIEYHRLLRDSRFGSELDSIPGVGPQRRAALLKEFKTMKAIRAADVQRLSAVVPKSTAEAVWRHFHEEEEK